MSDKYFQKLKRQRACCIYCGGKKEKQMFALGRGLQSQINRIQIVHHEIKGLLQYFKALFSQEMPKMLKKFIKHPQPQFNFNHKQSSRALREVENKQKKSFKLLQSKTNNSNIKEILHQQFRQIRYLEQQQNSLRQANSLLQRQRRSISRQRNQMGPLSCSKPEQRAIQVDIFTQKQYQQSKKLFHTEHKVRTPSFGDRPDSKAINSNVQFNYFKSPLNKIQNRKDLKIITLKCLRGHPYYIGYVKQQVPDGEGKLKNCCPQMPLKIRSDIVEYSGDFRFGKFEGEGRLLCKGNVRFEGQFMDGKREGKGTIFLGQVGEGGIWQGDKLV